MCIYLVNKPFHLIIPYELNQNTLHCTLNRTIFQYITHK